MSLPLHCATEDEPIPELYPDRWNGPDMRNVQPIADMLVGLRMVSDDEQEYVKLWRGMLKTVGGGPSVEFDREGARHLMICTPADPQIRHRSRWIHFLCKDLDGAEGRRDWLMRCLIREGCVCDNRPIDPRRTTHAMRGYLQIQGRIMLDPRDQLVEGGGFPEGMLDEDHEASARATRAALYYHETRRRFRSDRQIKRAVRMLGKLSDNGWIVLEART